MSAKLTYQKNFNSSGGIMRPVRSICTSGLNTQTSELGCLPKHETIVFILLLELHDCRKSCLSLKMYILQSDWLMWAQLMWKSCDRAAFTKLFQVWASSS